MKRFVDSFSSRKVIGLLTEAYTLRRFSAELELRRRELLGEIQPTASAQPDHEPFARFRGRRTGSDLAPRRSLMRERSSERSERLVG